MLNQKFENMSEAEADLLKDMALLSEKFTQEVHLIEYKYFEEIAKTYKDLALGIVLSGLINALCDSMAVQEQLSEIYLKQDFDDFEASLRNFDEELPWEKTKAIRKELINLCAEFLRIQHEYSKSVPGKQHGQDISTERNGSRQDA